MKIFAHGTDEKALFLSTALGFDTFKQLSQKSL